VTKKTFVGKDWTDIAVVGYFCFLVAVFLVRQVKNTKRQAGNQNYNN